MTRRSKASIAAKATRHAISDAVPDANRILHELALAYPEHATDEKALVQWIEGLPREERDKLVQEMIARIAKKKGLAR